MLKLDWGQQANLAFYSLKQQKLRSLLSMLGVVFGIISIVTLLSVGEGAKQKTLRQLEQLGANNIIIKKIELTQAQELYASERHASGLNERDYMRMQKSIPYLRVMASMREVTASVFSQSEEFYPEILSVSADYRNVYNLLLKEGRFISDLDIQHRNFICVLGSEIAERLGPEGQIGGSVRIENEMFKVVGILRNREYSTSNESTIAVRDINRLIYIPLNTEGYLLHRAQSTGFSEIVVKVTGKEYVFAAAKAIQSLLEHSHQGGQDYQIIVPQELIGKQKQTLTNFNIFLGAIAVISLIVGGIGIMNIMLANVSERTHEIGIRRAVGASQEHIKWQFLAESILISLSGGIIGVALGVLIVVFISLFGEWQPIIKLWLLALSLAMALIVGLCSGFYPASKASKMDPIEALRFE